MSAPILTTLASAATATATKVIAMTTLQKTISGVVLGSVAPMMRKMQPLAMAASETRRRPLVRWQQGQNISAGGFLVTFESSFLIKGWAYEG